MQTNALVQDQIKNKYVVSPAVKVVGEWNLNRYVAGVATNDAESAAATKFAADHRYPSLFPIASICNPWRWGRGIAYPIFGAGMENFKIYNYPTISESARATLPSRFYLAGAENFYKYWVSPNASSTTATMTDCSPMITYPQTIRPNKIVVKFNNHTNNPLIWSIATRRAGVWSAAAANIPVPTSTGVVEIYYNQMTSTWSTTPNYLTSTSDNRAFVDAIRINVSGTSLANAHIEVIEISPRLVADLTEYASSHSIKSELAGRDVVTPIGSASSNAGSITLSNDTGIFDPDNSDSPFSQMIDDGILYTVDVIYDDTNSIRQCTMISDTWEGADGYLGRQGRRKVNRSGAGQESVTVNLLDYAKIFQETKCPDLVLKNYRATNLIWRIMDAVGFPNVQINEDPANLTDTVDYFWCGKENMVWEIIQQIATSYQLAVFFDEFGVLQVMTRDYLYNDTRAADWDLTSTTTPGKISDMVSFSRSESLNYNKVTVKYHPANDFNDSGSRQQILWSPGDNYGIGASNIIKPISVGDTKIAIDPAKPDNIPFWTGKLVIGNFTVDYTGRGYYVNGVERQVSSDSDYAIAVEDNNGLPPKFTGNIYLKVPTTFAVSDINFYLNANYKVYRVVDGSTAGLYAQAAMHDQTTSAIRLTNATTSYGVRIQAVRAFGGSFDRVGAKLMMSSSTGGVGVTVWPQGSSDTKGYYFSVYNGDDPYVRGTQAIVRGIKYQNDGTPQVLSNPEDLRPPVLIPYQWHYLEVVIAAISGGWAFNLYFDGRFVGKFVDTSSPYPRTQTAGFYTVGPSVAHFDKFYIVDFPSDPKKVPTAVKNFYPDDAYYFAAHNQRRDSKVSRGDWAFAYYQRVGQRYGFAIWVDEFNAWKYLVAREVTTVDVRFTRTPALNASILNSNNLAVGVLDFQYTPMGATFVLKNNTDTYQPVRGTVETEISDAQRNEAFAIYGNTVFIMDTQSTVNEDDGLINRRGESAIEFDFQWMQSHNTAKKLADWVKKRFGVGTQTYQMEIFGNPLLQVGDIVTIDYSDRSISAESFRGVIASIQQDWDSGLKTSITVRKILNV